MTNRRAAAWRGWVLAAFAPAVASATEGEQVISGDANFTRDGDLLQIDTGTPQTIIQWNGGFDIGAGKTVLFNQPNAQSNVLNYDISTDASRIDGTLRSNGGVWIINPVGVFFGDQAIVDVGRLVAGAGTVDPGDFLAGVERFSDLTGTVEVAQGAQIRAAESALLVGAAVANYGHVAVGDGMIALVAGGEVRLTRADGRVVVTADRPATPDPDRWAVVQAGTLDAGRGSVSLTAGDAYSLAINHSGITRAREIHAEGGDGGLVEVAGQLDASSRAAGETGGRIEVLGEQVLVGDAALDASGSAGGGEIRVGGDLRGGGELRTARRTYVSDGATLRADALASGDGGRIIVWADDATRFYGDLSARGAGAGGDGGFAEISGKQSLVSRGAVDLGAQSGDLGTLLYDPLRIVIRGGSNDGTDTDDANDPAQFLRGDAGGAGSVGVGDAGTAGEPFVIFESELENTEANISLSAGQSIETQGTFAGNAVAIRPGRGVAMEVVDAGGTIGSGEILGIDLTQHDGAGELEWELSNGGSFALSTQSSSGRAVDIAVGAVDVSGEGPGSDAGSVTLLSRTGSIEVASIDASGGNATMAAPGDGGDGGAVVASALEGSITVGDVDVSGGNGRVHLVDNGAGGTVATGRGGNAGSISLVADIDPAGGPAVPGGDLRTVTVTGDLDASGGAGFGSVTDSSGVLGGAAGGNGGQMLISAGLLAKEDGAGRIVLGETGSPVTLVASGGAGTASGGAAAVGGTSALSGDAIGAIRIEARGDVTADAELVARGGDVGSSGPGGFGGLGGNVSIESEVGSVTLNDTDAASATPIVDIGGGAGRVDAPVVVNGVPRFDGQGGSAGSFTVAVAGAGSAVAVKGAVHARGGVGEIGAGGAGGIVTLTAADGAIEVADVDVSGADGSGDVLAPPATTAQGVRGGNGGNVTVTASAGTGDDAAGGGDVTLTGEIVSLGGEGDPNPDGDIDDPTENHGVGGTVKISSARDIAATDARIQAGTTSLTGVGISTASAADLVLAAAESGNEATVETATVEGAGDIRVSLENAERPDHFRFEVIQTEHDGIVDVRRANGTQIAAGSGSADVHTITQLTTQDSDPHFTYRLADPVVTTGPDGQPVELIDVTALAVRGVSVGQQGVKLANGRADAAQFEGERLLGKIQGSGAGPHVNATGNLEVFATHIGDTTPLAIAGAGGATPSVELTAAGNVEASVSGTVERVDLVQRSAAGDVAIDLPGAGAVAIDGTVVDDGSSRIETSVVTQVNTTSGPEFYLHLADDSISGEQPGRGEPVLQIASGAVTLGANAGFAAAGEVELARGAIDAGGQQVALVADSNLDGRGAIDALTTGSAPHVANAGALVAIASAGVGTADAPLRTSGAGEMLLAGNAGAGDFQLVNESASPIAIGEIEFEVANAGVVDPVLYGGVAAQGDVLLDNGGGTIELREGGSPAFNIEGPQVGTDTRFGFGDLRIPTAALQVPDPDVTQPHVVSGGDQRYVGSLLIGVDAKLQAGGEVAIEGDIDSTGAEGHDFEVSAGGTTTIDGDIGADAPLDALVLTDVRFSEGAHTVTAATSDFGAIDGPAALTLRGAGTGSRIAIRDDVGAREALTRFDADADLLVFGQRSEGGAIATSADRIVAGSVALNTANPSTSDAATIADTGGGLSIESAGDVAIGAGEKLSATEVLAISAGGTATLADLSASEIRVDAPRIVIQGRAPGAVAQPSGAVVTDLGVDWAGNNIATNVVPEWDGVGTRPTFALGSGGIRTGGAVPFDVVRFTPDLASIEGKSFAGADGRVLDLTGIGPRVVSDASQDVVRDATPVQPWLPARFDDVPPAPPRAVSGEELLAQLRCRDAAGEPCALPAPGDDPLASERARELTQRYRALVGSAEAQRAVAEAFAPLAQQPLPRTDAGGIDGRALARMAATGPELEPARARIGALAVALAEVELLGLEETESEVVRHAIASEFAAATGVPGLDADAALDAVDASGVAVLP